MRTHRLRAPPAVETSVKKRSAGRQNHLVEPPWTTSEVDQVDRNAKKM
jgi:hypothetical protein